MREVISVHVGQAGVQIGNACCKYSTTHVSSAASTAHSRCRRVFEPSLVAFIRSTMFITVSDNLSFNRGAVHG